MSLADTWADNVIFQAVADPLNLAIRIVELNKLHVSYLDYFVPAKTKRLSSSFRSDFVSKW